MRNAILSAAFVSGLVLQAQSTTIKPFLPSPAASVSQDLGICNVKVDYSRPGIKGRAIWGGLVPYGKVWRAGANGATVLTFSHPVTIAGRDLPAGSYALFAIPGPKAWTLILSGNPKQWGAEDYKSSEDVLRFEAIPEARTVPEEYLQYAIHVKSPGLLRLELAWEKLAVGFDVAMDAQGIYWSYLEKTLAGVKAGEAAPFAAGARYCLNSGTHLDQGLAWADRSMEARETYQGLDVKARLLQKLGRGKEALPLLDKAYELAEAAKAPQGYLDGLKKTRAEWTAK
jgi:hypothetical protein